MSRKGLAQGQVRTDAEEQYAGGDAAAIAGTSELARRTVALKAYRDRVASLYLQEVWEAVALTGYRTTHGGVPLADAALVNELRRQREEAMEIGR